MQKLFTRAKDLVFHQKHPGYYCLYLLLALSICTYSCKEPTRELVYSSELKGLFVYSDPDLESSLVYKIPFKAQFQILDREEWKSNWKKIEYRGKKGFISQKEYSFESPSSFVYVDSLAGVEFFEKPGDLERKFQPIPHKAKVEILKVLDFDYSKLNPEVWESVPYEIKENEAVKDGIWLHVKWEGKEGFIRLSEYLRLTPRAHFFIVVPSSGLTLRTLPDIKSPTVITLPQNSIGEILEVNPETHIIKNTRGFWFKTEYQSKVGWGFSGFTITSTDKSYLENKEYIRNEEWFIRYMESAQFLESYSLSEFDSSLVKFPKREIGNYSLLEIDYGFPPDDCGVTTNSRVVLQNNRNESHFSMQGIYREKVLAVNFPLPGTLFTEYDGCNCCCPMVGNILYFLLEEKVAYISFKEDQPEGYCFYGATEGVELARENRIDAENKIIYTNLKLPICKTPDSPEVTRAEAVDYPHSLFAVVRVEKSNVFIERYFDQGIPEKFREAWNKLKATKQSSLQ